MSRNHVLGMLHGTARCRLFQLCTGRKAIHRRKISSSPSPLLVRAAAPFSTMAQDRPRILVIGAGLMSAPVLEYLRDKTPYTVALATHRIQKGHNVLDSLPGGRQNISLLRLDVLDKKALGDAVSKYDLCISLAPRLLNDYILHQCLKHQVHLITPCYASKEMEGAGPEARERGVVVLCDMGLDPGLDHMLAMECIDHAHSQGGEVVSFVSTCGGFPEKRDNPLGYKYTWNPMGAMRSAVAAARFLRDGKVVEIPAGGELMRSSREVEISGQKYEDIPNQDSLKYSQLYKIPSVQTLLRCTLRYKGYTSVMDGLVRLGLTNPEPQARLQAGSAPVTWRDVLAMLVARSDVRQPSLEEAVLEVLGGDQEVYQAIQQLGLLSDEQVQLSSTPMDTLVAHLAQRLQYGPGEKDLTVLQNQIDIKYPDNKVIQHTVSMDAFGYPINGHSAMALTVGLPVAMAARLILEGKVKNPGLVYPVTPDVYAPILSEMRQVSAPWANWTTVARQLN